MRLTPLTISDDDPALWKLADVEAFMKENGVQLMATPDRGRIDIVGQLPDWAIRCLQLHYRTLVWWWRHSPCAVLVCDECGQWQVVGAKSRAGRKCFMGGPNRLTHQQKKMRMELINPTWGCQGTVQALDLPWTSNRPRRRTKKL